MKRVLICVLVSCLGLLASAQNLPKTTIERINKFVDKAITDFNIPAVAIGIIENGKLVYKISRGEKVRGSGEMIDETYGFQIASLSKSFTGIIANSLSQVGKIDLEKPLSSYLKEELDESQVEQFSKITLKDVLQHRAGLPNNGASVPPTPNGSAMIGGYSLKVFLKDLAELRLDDEKLGKFNYSNFGFGLVGYVISKVTGKAYEELLQEYVTVPNEMSFTTSKLESVRAQLVTPYHVHKRNSETKPWEMGMQIPAGGILSNVEDLAKLLIAEMTAYQSYKVDGTLSPLVLTADKKPLNDIMNYGYGFFESKNSYDNSITQLGHGGDVDGYASFFEFYPDQDLGLVMLTSSGGTWFNDLKGDVERLMLGIPVKEGIKLSKSVLKRYVGKYDFGKDQVMTIFRRGNYLMSYMGRSNPARLYAESETKFFYKGMDSAYEFELDKKGRVKKTVYVQNGQKFYPEKIK